MQIQLNNDIFEIDDVKFAEWVEMNGVLIGQGKTTGPLRSTLEMVAETLKGQFETAATLDLAERAAYVDRVLRENLKLVREAREKMVVEVVVP